MIKTAELKGTKISKLLKSLMELLGDKLFRYQVRCGLILCIAEGDEIPAGNNAEGTETEVETETENTGEGDDTQSEEAEEVVVSIGEESPASEEQSAEPAPEWVKQLRKDHRELKRRNSELEERLKATVAPEQKPVQLGQKPTLEGCDYDAEKFETQLEAWHLQKGEVEKRARQAEQQAEEENKAWKSTLDGYSKAKTELKVKDFEDAEDVVKDALSVVQQGIVLQGCSNPALVIYALGKNPKKAKELAAIKDPVKFAFAIADLQKDLKVTTRKTAPAPEKTVRGNASVSGTVDSQLEKLRAEAEKTGNYTKVVAHKKQMREKGK